MLAPAPASPEAGITLVELVCVLLILGVLSAVIAPRFSGLSTDAHRINVERTARNFGSALNFALASCVLANWQGKDNLPHYGDGTVDFNAACYPVDTNRQNEIGNSNARCIRVWETMLTGAVTVTAGPGGEYRAQATSDICTFRYQLDTDTQRQFTYNSLTGEIVVTNP